MEIAPKVILLAILCAALIVVYWRRARAMTAAIVAIFAISAAIMVVRSYFAFRPLEDHIGFVYVGPSGIRGALTLADSVLTWLSFGALPALIVYLVVGLRERRLCEGKRCNGCQYDLRGAVVQCSECGLRQTIGEV